MKRWRNSYFNPRNILLTSYFVLFCSHSVFHFKINVVFPSSLNFAFTYWHTQRWAHPTPKCSYPCSQNAMSLTIIFWSFIWQILKQWWQDPATRDIYCLILVCVAIHILSCAFARNSHNKIEDLLWQWTEANTWFLCHFDICITEFSLHQHTSVQHYNASKASFVIGSRVEVASLKLFTSKS